MKTSEGWVRGKRCGKNDKDFAKTVKWVCANCYRTAEEPADLCYPVRVEEGQR